MNLHRPVHSVVTCAGADSAASAPTPAGSQAQLSVMQRATAGFGEKLRDRLELGGFSFENTRR